MVRVWGQECLFSRVTMQRNYFNLCAKLEYRIKHLPTSTVSIQPVQRELNCHFLINWHYKSLRKVGEATENNNFHI